MLNNMENGADVDPIRNMPNYWTFQIAGWFAFAVLSVVTLNVWYNPGQLIPALHSFVQAALGIVVSHPLRWIAKRTWNAKPVPRIFINAFAILIASQVWTVLRLEAFTSMTGLPIGAEDWGGWIFGSMTVFASWAFCYHALKYYRQWLEQRELSIKAQNAALAAEALAERENVKRLYAENQMRESKLQLLNYQLNPHFFFNSLNSVTALVKRDDKDGAMEMLSRIGDFLRATLDDHTTSMHPLRDEVEILKRYLDIEKVRFGERLNPQISIAQDAAGVEVPGLILQPLIENSIKHAVGKSLSPTTIKLTAFIETDQLRIRLSDTGIGVEKPSANATMPSPGIGRKNVEERLRSVYGEQFHFAASANKEGGFTVSITLPLDVDDDGAASSFRASDTHTAPREQKLDQDGKLPEST